VGFWKVFRGAWKEARAKNRIKHYIHVVSAEPFTVDLVKKICVDYGHSFRFQFINGDYIEFPKLSDSKASPYLDLEEQSINGG